MTERFRIIKIFAFLSVVLVLLLIFSNAVSPLKSKVQMDKTDKLLMEFNNERENSIDVIVLGDSEAYRSISPLDMYRDYGFTSFVTATPAQMSGESLDILKKVIERQNPKICILDTNLLFRENSHVFSVLPKLEAAFPLFKYHNVWKSFFSNKHKTEAISDGSFKGYRYSAAINPVKDVPVVEKTDKVTPISQSNIAYINKIISLCSRYDIELVLVSTPSVKNWDYQKHNSLIGFAKENKISFIDLNLEDSVKIDWNTDTLDKGDHLNYNGACKVTSYLGSYLHSNFELPDHRSDKEYSSWNDVLEVYLKTLKK